MVGSRGKGSRTKSKSRGVAVPADSQPLNACRPNDGEEDNEAFLVMENEKVCDGVDAIINMDDGINNEITTDEQSRGKDLVGSGINNEMGNEEELREEDLVDSGINNVTRNKEERGEEDIVDFENKDDILEEDEEGEGEEEEQEEEEEEEEDLINNGPDVITHEDPKSLEDNTDEIDGPFDSSKGGASNEDKPLSSVVKGALGEACKEDETEPGKNEGKPDVGNVVNVNRKRKRLRKKGPQKHLVVVAPASEHNPKPTNNESESKETNQTVQQDTRSEGAEKSEGRVSNLKKRKRKKVAKKGAQKVNADDVDNPGSSKNGNSLKRMESMGMICMCSSQTKKDCYQYKVLGLPAAKKELVSKIYKGMRLFLFDFELKMLHGIYKAASPGGYDIEPRAFKSKFPAQVRFTVQEDCLPLAEENFKNIIKDNYYTKNKFNCELTSEQVKNLCQLFRETTKKAGAKLDAGVRKPVASSSARRERKRKRVEDNPRVVPVPVKSSDRKRRDKKDARRAPLVAERSQRRDREEARRAPRATERTKRRPQEGRRIAVATDKRYRQPTIVYDRETFLPSVASASLYQPRRAEDPPLTRPLYQPLRAEDPHTRALYQPLRIEDSPLSRAYAYARPVEIDTYRRERPAEVDTYRREYRDHVYPGSQALRYTVDRDHAEPYDPIRQPLAERDRANPYNPISQPLVYREPEYRADNRREHYDYPSGIRYVEEYRSADYISPLPVYRRY